ncbi:hypothetical protein DSCW_26760 [Desulfosarcina widdelii]|uniref:Periplasmic heavy metal sensor n=1 Tax=Desulfosarcina widdelii TaxID=947919 RepID=A0A5K7Z4X6_9BACT|nr:hypothetical protein [Desulfosarcina widdelii]BBO75259.1 hypothetical protein DSCW_26760 [Desulfosarcina widdelii]
MNRWKVIAGILLIFILGALTGAMGTNTFFKHRIKRFMDPKGPPPPILILQRQMDELTLSQEQQNRIDALFDDMHREFTDLWKKSQPVFKQLFDQYLLRIREVLNPAQQEKLDRTVDRIEKRMERMKPPPPPEKRGGLFDAPRLQKELGLTADQAEKGAAILKDLKKKSDAVHRRFDEEMLLLHDRMDAELKQVWSDGEARLSDVMSRKQMERLRIERGPRPGPRP